VIQSKEAAPRDKEGQLIADHGEWLSRADPEISRAISLELKRERERINLTASENYAPLPVLEATCSVLTNKYAEGYPERRYYSGCEVMDVVERLAIERAKELFGADHANVQPHSGAQANMAVYFAALNPGDKLMAMDLSAGGHLTHGARANFSGLLYNPVHYGVDEKTERLDYDAIGALALKERPKMIIAGASSYPRTIDFEAFREIADRAGALLMVDMAHFCGLVAAKLHPDPVPYSDFVTSTTHKTLRGPRGGFVLTREEYCEKLDSAVFPGTQGGPLMHVIAAKAVCFKEAGKPRFTLYQQATVANARALSDKLASEGFRMVSGGTDTHLFLIDLRPIGVTGREAQDVLDLVDINVNMNEIPFDKAPPTVTSGIRIGTPSVTTRGMMPEDMGLIGDLIARAIKHRADAGALAEVRGEVRELTRAFPIYPEL
jgi:glycine hydroxymethyltransferase